MKLIEACGLKKTYLMGETEVSALKGIDLTVEKGEYIAITGSSGSGKSTLMHLLGCLDIPSSGTYLLDNIDISNATKDELAIIRNKKIGFVFQKFYLLPDLSARDNVALPCLYADMDEKTAHKKATELLTMVNLEDRINYYPSQLSGGQQQRVAIARALANEPEIIFADEPTGNLDTTTGNVILNIFQQLNNNNITIIMVTHEPDVAARCKRVLQLHDGLIIKDSTRAKGATS